MASPSEADLRKVKRLVRYIQSSPKVVITTGADGEGEHITYMFVESDWADSRQGRRALAERCSQ